VVKFRVSGEIVQIHGKTRSGTTYVLDVSLISARKAMDAEGEENRTRCALDATGPSTFFWIDHDAVPAPPLGKQELEGFPQRHSMSCGAYDPVRT
jgi:hypothetical protein